MKNEINCFLKKQLVLITTCIAFVTMGYTQTTNVGTWNIVDAFYKANNTYTIWLEAQTRSQNLASDFYYHELKTGLFYNFGELQNSLFVGTGKYTTYSYEGNYHSPVLTDETRVWEQLSLNNVYQHLKLEHRYRLEQRWVNNVFKPRFRYRLNTVYAINNSKVVPKTLFVSAFDELFFGNNNPRLERNRYYLGMGYQFSKTVTLQMGYIHQTDFNATGGETGKDFLQTTLMFFIEHKQTKKETTSPTIMD